MMFLFYVLLTVNILLSFLSCKYELGKGSPIGFFWLLILVTYLVPSLSDPFLGNVKPHQFSVQFHVGLDTLIYSQLIILICVGVLSMYSILSRNDYCEVRYSSSTYIKGETGKVLLYVILLSTILYAFYDAYTTFGGNLLNITFLDRRELMSGVSKFILTYVLISASGLFAYFYFEKKVFYAFLVFVVYIVCFLVFGGSRQLLFVIFLPIVLEFIRRSNKQWLLMFLLVFIFSYIFKFAEYLLYLRNLSSFEDKISALPGVFDYVFFGADKLGSNETSLRFAFYYFVDIFDTEASFGNFEYLKRVLLFWLPSGLDFLSIKPKDFEYEMFSVYMPGYNGTLHPTFFGSLLADGASLFFIWLVFPLCVFFLSNSILNKSNGVSQVVCTSLFGYYFMLMSRGAMYGPFVVLFFGLALSFFIHKIFGKKNETSITRYG
ncbi:O-antigen polymerase [Vibrio parahaemolyticus]|uniref:O-antigen polymerase n=1 Tax=Vibrio parahaemolyticus TaxID=670 RepID=UPI00111F2F4A|nr:O-antigen polymerase [Vibrio parahaemolyticus]EGR9013199.1 oligosaccharide repeat unit polymerase [Vibrio parahaemolyticus]ELA9290301.1 oligosaccharide repeat unit polymerase [Vibrio parahaemolyticus]MCR9972011.1 oligosaccharide repeat unit polymerase [Vibrio parahaemolyticus]MCS0018955.1 oligosaccharide repeat unit polymerase [Vibrio parahaemolyticus]MCS0055800.1 oligosaccharide repeat unit polymerase [Vibrio parahaemolyticus]